MCIPHPSGHDLDHTTQLFNDTYIALELLHMRYPEYIQRVPPLERLHYQLYLSLKAAKEKHAHERMLAEQETERAMEAENRAMGRR